MPIRTTKVARCDAAMARINSTYRAREKADT